MHVECPGRTHRHATREVVSNQSSGSMELTARGETIVVESSVENFQHWKTALALQGRSADAGLTVSIFQSLRMEGCGKHAGGPCFSGGRWLAFRSSSKMLPVTAFVQGENHQGIAFLAVLQHSA